MLIFNKLIQQVIHSRKMEECVHWTQMDPLPAEVNRAITLEQKKKGKVLNQTWPFFYDP